MFKKILIYLSLSVLILQARVILDDYGEKVTLPDKIEWASPMVGAFVQIAVSLGNGDKIISGAYRGLFPMMLKVFPNIKMTGFMGGSLGASVETIINSKTQVVFGPAGVLFDDNVKKQLESTGIAVVRISNKFATINDVKARTEKVAEIFGEESVQKAKEINDYLDESVAFVRSRTNKISPKKRVLVLNFNLNNYTTIPTNNISAEYIKIAGGENLGSQVANSFGFFPNINEEQIMLYNPDIIITNSQESLEQIRKNRTFKQIKAVKNKQIFVQPRGVIYLWSGTQGALQVLWLAKTLYPELFKDLDMRSKVREFYAKFYKYDLSEDELTEILNPKEKPRVVY